MNLEIKTNDHIVQLGSVCPGQIVHCTGHEKKYYLVLGHVNDSMIVCFELGSNTVVTLDSSFTAKIVSHNLILGA